MALVVVVGVSMSGCAVKIPQARLTLEGSESYGSELVVIEAGEVQALFADVRNELGANPALQASVSRATVDWAPAIRDLGRGEPVRLQISPAMASSLIRLVEDIRVSSVEPELGVLVSRLDHLVRSAVESGRPIVLELAPIRRSVKLEQLVDDASLRLGGRERGLAREGETLVVPASAHAGGALGTRWRTDLVLTATDRATTLVNVELLPRGQANPNPEELQLELVGGQARVVEDALDELFGFNGAAALRLTSENGTFIATSRTYNLEGNLGGPDARTFGQFLPALSADDAIVFGDEGRLLLLAHDPTLEQGQRTNLILVNGSGEDVDIDIDLFSSDGVELGDVEETLQAWEYRQFDGIFEDVTSEVVDDGYAVVEVETPGGRVYALASVVDNMTGDPVAVPAVLRSPFEEKTLHETQIVQAAAKIEGVGDTDWRTDLVLHALTGDTPTQFSVLASLELLPRGQENTSPETRQVMIPMGQSVRFDDVLESLFETDGAASIRVTPYGGAAGVESRTYNLLGEGNAAGYPEGATFGQYLGPVGYLHSVTFGDEAWIPHLSHDPSLTRGSRANLGLVNNSPRPIDVEVDLHNGDGMLLGSFTQTLRMWENVQIGKVFERVTNQAVTGGYAVLRTTHPAGAFVAHGSVVDNRTGDPITIDAVVIRKAEPAGVVASGDMLMQLFESGFDPGDVFELLRAGELQGYLDELAVEMPDRAMRTADGIVFDLGSGAVLGETMLASGTVDFSDATATDGTSVTGTVTVDFDELGVDGRSPVVEDLQLGLALAQVDGDQVEGTVTLASSAMAKSVSDFGGSLEFDTRICERYPIGGSITVTIGGELRTITFDDSCDGSFQVDIPSAAFYALNMPMNDCAGNPPGEDPPSIHMVDEDGQLSADPSSPAETSGRLRFVSTGRVNSSSASVLFGQRGGSDGERRIGSFVGTKGQGGYWAGIYGYTVSEGECSSSYHHGRDAPGFSPGIMIACTGPCWQ